MTTEVAFHTGVEDKLGYACRLLRKAYRQGLRVVVRGSIPELQRLDQALWTFEPHEFIPHVRLAPGRTPAAGQARTPIWLLDPGAEAPCREVLVNLGPGRVEGDSSFERVFELVGREPQEAQEGRSRWKSYQAEGWTIKHHPQAAAGEG